MMAKDMLYLPLRLIQSALGQKVEVKLLGPSRRERSQDRSVMSAEKTRITTCGKGYSFLGFVMSSRSRRVRPKSQDKFKDKVRELTARKRNLDAQLIEELNRVLQGTANYFAPRWSTNRRRFRQLDAWVRRRLRCMKFKRFSYHHNRRMRLKQFARLGLVSMESFCWS